MVKLIILHGNKGEKKTETFTKIAITSAFAALALSGYATLVIWQKYQHSTNCNLIGAAYAALVCMAAFLNKQHR